MSEEQTLDFRPLLSKVKHSLIRSQKLQLVVNSLNRADSYSGYFWNQYLETSKRKKYLGWSMNRDENGFNDREKCEANVIGFLHNIHIICDQFPFALKSSILEPLYKRGKPLTDQDCGWSRDFLKSIEALSNTAQLVGKMKEFEMDEDFQTLKKIMNLSKHRYLIEFVWRDGNFLFIIRDFDEIQETSKSEHDVDALMVRISNNVMPKIYDLYEEAKKI
jgi:hypothetical protein